MTPTAGAVGVADITINNLVQAGRYSTIEFRGGSSLGAMPTDPSGYGQTTLCSHVYINNIDGEPLTVTNGIIAGWAFRDDTFATYDSIAGVGNLGQTGGQFLGFSAVPLNLAGPNDVINQTEVAGVTTRTIYGLRVSGAGRIAMASPTDTLTIASGGLVSQNSATYLQGGKITSGLINDYGAGPAGELYVHVYGNNTFQINSRIVDNGSTPVMLIKSGTGTLSLTGLGGSNTYTGGTTVNGRYSEFGRRPRRVHPRRGQPCFAGQDRQPGAQRRYGRRTALCRSDPAQHGCDHERPEPVEPGGR